ncbi:RCC1 domain-containing protein [Brevibacillus laterosporus]|uniref:RCC1 domain-containing protein n=1 Tax=Brevibacillus laterosporus TaxID=1465 RepID=UPI0015E1F5BA|nr:hypothetical protein [Brevibacillus laterosporus]
MESLDQLKKIVIGNESTFLLNKNGRTFVSGLNRHNKFGLKDKENKLKVRPYQAVDLLDIHNISTSSFHSLFVTNKGEVYSGGLNMRGQLGLGHNKPPYAGPLIQIPELKHVKVKKTCASELINMALTYNGEVYMWGENRYGAMGNGSDIYFLSSPIPLQFQSMIVDIAISDNTCFVLDADQKVYAWGENSSEQIYEISESNICNPVLVPYPVPIVQIVASPNFMAALSQHGDVFFNGRMLSRIEKKIYSTELPIIEIVCGTQHIVMVDFNRNLHVLGSNSCGCLGVGKRSSVLQPEKIEDFTSIDDVYAGGYQTWIKINDQWYAAGQNSYLQLGIHSSKNQNKSIRIPVSSQLEMVLDEWQHVNNFIPIAF